MANVQLTHGFQNLYPKTLPDLVVNPETGKSLETSFEEVVAGFGVVQAEELVRVDSENLRQSEETERTLSEELRVLKESQRVLSENERLTNEADRVTKEGLRGSAEIERKDNEGKRVSAETVREANEVARKTGYTGMDGRIKTGEAMMENIVWNGDFSNGGNMWANSGGTSTLTFSGGVATHVVGTVSAAAGLFQAPLRTPLTANEKFYASVTIKPFRTHNPRIYMGRVINFNKVAPAGVFTTVSTVDYVTEYRDALLVYANEASTTEMVSGSKTEFKNILIVNLTRLFGIGLEPTKEQMDRLLTQFPNSWFDGTKNVFLARWALAELKRLDDSKANRKQEEWVTPTLVNGWTSSPSYPVGFMIDEFGFVHLKGRLVGGSLLTTAFTLPVGYRPKQLQPFAVAANGFGQVNIGVDGSVTPNYGTVSVMHLENIIFKT